MTDHALTEMDEHLSREDRVLARLRRRSEDYARQPPERPVMWSVIVIGLSAGAAMLAAGSVFARLFLLARPTRKSRSPTSYSRCAGRAQNQASRESGSWRAKG